MSLMALHRTIIRYFLIIKRVRRDDFPSLETIWKMLKAHDFKVSTRTLQRDLENIRTDFGIEIRYNSGPNGYDIDYERSVEMESLIKFNNGNGGKMFRGGADRDD